MRPPSYRLRTADGFEIDVNGARLTAPRGPAACCVELGPGSLRPGLINAHDHLQLNHFPRLGQPPYANAYDWGHDIHARCSADIHAASAFPRGNAYLFGALKNLLGGVTSVVHHDPWDPQLNGSFPIHAIRVRVAHSLRFERDMHAALVGDAATWDRPISMHLAEGTDVAAADEIRVAYQQGLLGADMLAVHLVGADAEGIHLLQHAGSAGVWCPTSNRFLLDRTAPAGLFDSGLDILMGTDSLLTADGTMLDELREAVRLGLLSPARLDDATGELAARRLGLPPPTLDPGAPADLIMLRAPLGEATSRDVALVIVDGAPRLGDESFGDLFAWFGIPTERLIVGGVPKLVMRPLATVARQAAALSPDVGRILA